MIPSARRSALAVVLSAGAAAPVMAAGPWDVSGSVGVNAGRSVNPGFVGRANPGYNPNLPICTLQPSDPNYDESICDQPFLSASTRRGELYGSVGLSGTLTGQWANTTFGITYSPTAHFYYERSHLNQVGHDLVSNWRHNYTPRTSLNLSENYNYSPEQDLDPNNLQANNLLTLRTSRTSSRFRGALGFQPGPKTTLTWSYLNYVRGFSSPDYLDSVSNNAGFQWQRRVGHYHSVSSGYEYGLYAFGQGVPGSDRHQANVGYGFMSPHGFNLNLSVGYNVLLPHDSTQDNAAGTYANSSVGWNGQKVAASAGYTRGFSDGGGAYANAQTEVTSASFRWTITPSLLADLTASHNVHERAQTGSTPGATSEVVRSFNGRAGLNYSITQEFGLNAYFTQYIQTIPGALAGIPDARGNRYTLGVNWRFR